ncbi:hypothetical protein L873DRAFT_1748797 [Choiromyces venosus 120613-1]|uniref:Uncharacterized protein n=1 Tax=Choiromyces venosus 120613-1 TaxID=1336337 RepID=A0A3N4J558_9PEZI|nr:hypothetical protein L873DRAFT_1748797 [Choiromyces venosus 120613-1]
MARFSLPIFILLCLAAISQTSALSTDPESYQDPTETSNTPSAKFLKAQYSLCPGPDPGLLRAKNPFLYKWVGSYYSGTLETTISLTNSSASCLAQVGTFNRSLTAVLSVIDEKYHTSKLAKGERENPFILLLNGWIPGDKLSGENLVPSQMPSGVLVDFESIQGFRQGSNGGKYGGVGTPSVVNLNAGRSGNGWGFMGSYTNSTDQPLGIDSSSFVYEFPTCNATQYANFLVENYPSSVANSSSFTTLSGTFSPFSAEFSISGPFAGYFDSWRLGDHKIDIARDKVQYGSYKMVFRGMLDTKHSHNLVVDGGVPAWVPDDNKTMEYACVQKGAGVRGREVMWWVWVVLDVLILTMWSGM